MTLTHTIQIAVALASALIGYSRAVTPVLAGEPLTYPIIFSSKSELEAFGFSLVGADERPEDNPWRAKACGDHSVPQKKLLLAVSDDIIANYAEQGFTRQTFCLAIASAALYDPYDGERLPSFVFRDDIGIKALLKDRDPDDVKDSELVGAGVLTEEIPLAVPGCFKKAQPHIDCEWRFSVRTGYQRTQRLIAIFAKAGAELKEVMASVMNQAPAGIARPGAFKGTPADFKFPDEAVKSLVGGQPLTYGWFVFDPALQGGYGYVTAPADNERRPTVSASAILAKLGRKQPASQISAAYIKAAIAKKRQS